MAEENTAVEATEEPTTALAGAAEDKNTAPEDTESPAPVEGEGESGTSEDAKEDDKDQTEGAPETYEDFTFPEGVEADAKLMEQFVPIAKELNLTQEQAQKLVNIQAESQLAEAKAGDEMLEALYDNELKASKQEFGEKFDEVVASSVKALKNFGSPELQDQLSTTWMGNNKHVLQFLSKIGNLVSDDQVHAGTTSNQSKSRAEILFGKTSPN